MILVLVLSLVGRIKLRYFSLCLVILCLHNELLCGVNAARPLKSLQLETHPDEKMMQKSTSLNITTRMDLWTIKASGPSRGGKGHKFQVRLLLHNPLVQV